MAPVGPSGRVVDPTPGQTGARLAGCSARSWLCWELSLSENDRLRDPASDAALGLLGCATMPAES